ncbi:hypothetical protein [Zavarzinia sp.]|uniref:hypothetical protein n=1 Tax=Zavarzinia sp. TaxID=2027920 RepID=UPI003BB75D2A
MAHPLSPAAIDRRLLDALAAVQCFGGADGDHLARLFRIPIGRLPASADVRPEGRDAARMGVSSQLAPPRITGAAAFSAG